MQTKEIALKNLVIDDKLTELRPINQWYISQYRKAYRNNANMPLPIIEKDTNRVVSGNHRVTAMIEEYGKEHEVNVEIRTYKNELEVMREFAKENARHGNPLGGFARRRIMIELSKLGDQPENVAQIFNVPVKEVIQAGEIRMARVGGSKKEIEEKPVKRGAEIPEGQVISEKEYRDHVNHDRGVPILHMVNQLTKYLQRGWVSDKEQNITGLIELNKEIQTFLNQVQKNQKVA